MKLTPKQWDAIKWHSGLIGDYPVALDEIWNDDGWDVWIEGTFIYYRHRLLGTLQLVVEQ